MHTNVFQVQSFENKFTAVEGPYLNQHLGASCKLQNAKRSKNPCNKLFTAINWPGKIKTKSWQQKVDWSVCLPPCWEEKFCNKEFDEKGGEKELIDQQRHLNAEKYEDIAKSLRILKTTI